MRAPTFASVLLVTLALGAYPLACSSSSPGEAPSDAGADVGSSSLPEGSVAIDVDAGPSDPTIIAEGLTLTTNLTVVDSASKIFWVENAAGANPTLPNAIRSVATTGGTPSLVLAAPTTSSIASPLASDGTSLYYVAQESADDTDGSTAITVTAQLMKCGLDGSSPTLLGASPNAPVTALFVANGTLFAQAAAGLYSIATSAASGTVQTIHTPGQVQGLYGVDATSLYYAVGGGVTPYPAPPGLDFYASPFDGASANLLVTLPTTAGPNGAFLLGGVAVTAGTLYITGGVAGDATIYAAPTGAPADGGAATTLATLDSWLIGAVVADGSGMYITQAGLSNSDPAGIYSVSLTTGATTLFRQDTLGPYGLAMDATDVYWLDDVTTTGQALHALAR